MPVKITASEQPLQKVFCSDFDFSIPLYQRPYSWTQKEAGELFSDLLDNIADSNTQVDDLDPYFLGSIVLVKGDTAASETVDGQQRLTTLTILFAVARALLTPAEAEGLTTLLYEIGNPILGTNNRYRLTLRQQDAEFFRTHIQSAGGIDNLQALHLAQTSDSQINIRDNALWLSGELEKLSPRDRSRLIQFAARRCYLVVVATPDFNSAYRIFTVLNNRGLDLTNSDILKAELIGTLLPSKQRAYTIKWEETEDILGRDGFQDLFAHIRMIRRKAKPSESIVEEYKKYIVPKGGDAARFIDDDMIPYADAYRTIKTATYQSTSAAEPVNTALRWLNRIDNSDWVPPAIRYVSRNANDPFGLAKFLADLERLAAGQMILRNNINERINRYARVLTAIDDNTNLYVENSPLQLTEREKQDIVAVLNGDLYLEGKIRLYVLLRLDAELSEGVASYDYPIISVEHVVPQTPSPDSDWMKWFPTEESRQRFTHRVGNLLLLSRRKNSEAQNYDFSVKKKKYFSSKNGVACFPLISQVLNEREWTQTVVEARQKELLEKLKDLWRL